MSLMTFRRYAATTAAILALAGTAAQAAAPPASHLNFVACPMVRDTDEVPCWVTEYKGEMYYMGITLDLQSPFFPPQLSHKALVEGVPNPNKPRICGGIVLDPVQVSSLPELDLSCQTILPAENYKIDFARRGKGPDPIQLSAVNQAAARQVEVPKPPFQPRTFTIYYDFDSDFMPTRANRNITAAMRYATQIKASSIVITGYQGSALLSDGTRMKEYDYLAERRTKAAHFAIVDIGAPAAIVKSSWKTKPEVADGVDDHLTRKVEIVVTP